ncbi:translation initiation factor IF-2 [Aureococcus anophagefferens]|nr:translation initiation factor IF-2 [Aureococcus anophagefferens]
MARVRAAYGVNLEAYCRAWKTISKKARFTAGASGALFLFSDDERFIAKTATLSEIQTLAKMAPDLAAYVEGEAHGGACSRSRLGRLLGAHTLYLYGRRLHRRASPRRAGAARAARGRLFTSAPPADLVDVECPFGNFGHKPNVDGKDNDLEEKLQLPDAQARELVQQLDRDTKFLASRGIMDYSLLVGITMQEYHVKTYARRDPAGDSLASRRTVPARIAQGPATYTLGIIDMLQEWDLGKRAEACCKVRCKCQSRRGISAVAPSEYQERFMDHVENIIAEDAGQPRLTNLADRPTLV